MIHQVSWEKQKDQSFSGEDQRGNKYRMTANQEWVSVTMKDGRTGSDWTAEGALAIAKAKKK